MPSFFGLNIYLKRTLLILSWLIGSIIGLLILIFVLIQFPFVQNIAKNKVVTFLENKIGTPVQVERINIDFPKQIILENFYFESKEKDTLLYGKKLIVDIDLFKILKNKIDIQSINLQDVNTHISRSRDSVFNFDYIIKAFVKEQTTANPSDSTVLEFSLNKINLDRIRVRFDDELTKNNLNFSFSHFDTKINKFDFIRENYDISVINLDNLKLKLQQGIVEDLAQSTQKLADSLTYVPQMKLKLGKVNLSNIDIVYGNSDTRIQSKLNWDFLSLKFNDINFNKQLIDIERADLTRADLKFILDKNIKPADTKVEELAKSPNANDWSFKITKTNAKKVNFIFDDENSNRLKHGIDYMHLNVKNLNLEANQLFYSLDSTSLVINQASFKEKSGLNVISLSSDIIYTNRHTLVKNLVAQTPSSFVRSNAELYYPSLYALSNQLESVYINANVNSSKISYKDFLIFVPQLKFTKPFSIRPSGTIFVNSKIKGRINNLHIPYLQLSGLGDSKINASGFIKGLPNTMQAYYDLNIKSFKSTKRDILTFAPKGTIPPNIRIPDNFAFSGTFRGKIDRFSTNIAGNSSFGGFKINASYNQQLKNSASYAGKISLMNFNLGRFLKQEKTIGRVSLAANFKGVGIDMNTASAAINGKIYSIGYNGYNYKNINLNAVIKNGLYNVKSDINDPNLKLSLLASGSLNNALNSLNLQMDLKNADLGKLKFFNGKLALAGNIEAKFTSIDPDNLNGYAILNKSLVIIDNQKFVLDSVYFNAKSTKSSNRIEIKAPFMYALLDGKFQLTKLSSALSKSFSKYYTTTPNLVYSKIPAQNFTLQATIQPHPVITNLITGLKKFETIQLNGRYNSIGDTINLKVNAPNIVYGSNTIVGSTFDLLTNANALDYKLNINEIRNAQILLPRTSIEGNIANNLINYYLNIRDKQDKEKYAMAGNMKASLNTTEIRINNNGLKLNYQPWNVANGNLIKITNQGFQFDQFNLSYQNQSVNLQSTSGINSPLKLDFSNFKIETITNMFKKDSLLVGGTINGNTLLSDISTSPKFTSDLIIKDFNFKQDTLGNILLKVNNYSSPNIYNANVQISGNDNSVNLDGFYNADKSSFDMNLQLQKLNLKSIQGFSLGYISNSSGFLTGNFKLSGTVDDPKLRGDLQFNNGAFRVSPLNTYYQLLNDKISFNDDGIQFDNFSFEDSTNNKLHIDGIVYTQNYQDYRFNLEILANNFKAMNSTAADNDLYYGQLFLDTRIRVRGDMNKPIIDGDLKVNDDTKLTIVMPQSDPGIVEREGIVEFVDKDFPQANIELPLPDSLNKSRIKGLDISLNIEVEDDAELNLVIDKGNGDFVKLKGEAKLNATIDPSGKTSVTGRYDLNEGAYEMSFNFIRRKFVIKDGSSIVWNGEPTLADINITATYVANTAPIDLLDNQLSGLTNADRNTYKQKLPFEVQLNMNGELLKPVITFDVVLPEGNYNVAESILSNSRAKLAQIRNEPSEMNKQVFALLLLNRFIGENPFSSEAGSGGVGALAKQSVSKILTQQLNDMAANLIAGVDLNFDLEATDDYTTGQRASRTDLNVGLSKQLLNDRLKVTIGSSFGLEGPQQGNRQTNNIAGDISVDYQLSSDGRYRLRAYRKNQYQVALQGQIIETGLGFIINMDYNKFKEIFMSSKKRRNDEVVEIE